MFEKRPREFSILFLFLLGSISLWSQDVIHLNNASFEDIPHRGQNPYQNIKDWFDCSLSRFPGESPPDIHPTPDTAWSVTQGPVRGKTYLGMVVRGNDTWESVAQRLTAPMNSAKCYGFSVFLSQSNVYRSATSWNSSVIENFTRPIVLRIWGGYSMCDRGELLAESPAINHSHWQRYSFKFEPKGNYNYIIMEAFYKTPVLTPYNGNLLLDGSSEIIELPCSTESVEKLIVMREREENAVAVQAKPSKPAPSTRPSTSQTRPPETGTKPAEPEPDLASRPTKLNILSELQREKLHEGKIIRIKNLHFEADSFRIEPNSYPVLNELFQFLVENPGIIVEIGGHTNTIPSPIYCDKLSASRARAVTDYLIKKGVPPRQLSYKGYGKRKPLVADDRFSKAAKEKNQRVEIKLLRIEEQ